MIETLFVIVAIYAGVVSYLHFVNNPLPWPDKGHRCFGVKNQKAAVTLAGIMKRETGISERFTFRPAPTNQMLMSDMTTVLLWGDDEKLLRSNALSLMVKNPLDSATDACAMLRGAGFRAEIVKNYLPEAGDKLVVVQTDAFADSLLVFRKHLVQMGKIPGKTKLT